jgi:putative CocE/NonD family hydrolase
MNYSRRTFLTTAAAATVGVWHRPAWSATRVRVPPANRRLQVIENTWIELPDGTKLAARILLPDDAPRRPVGAILEYIPYNKRSITREFDDRTAAWLVPRGFALVRVDIRGTGDSEGTYKNEYDLPEQADTAPVIRWIAGQPWCNGKVGMRGFSYGGFVALQAARKGIPELVAIMPAVGTENGYTDDVHTLGGCIINEKVNWGGIYKAIIIAPPDPEIVGDRWHTMWLERLNAQFPMVAEWMRHQLVDEYWRARILTDYSQIKCAVYANGGMIDAYVNTVPRLLERLRCPRKGLVGPWGHGFPDRGAPGPMLDWAVEECRWWDYWLNGHDNGIMDEPMLRTYMADGCPAQSFPHDTPGRWVAEKVWPSPSVKSTSFFPSPAGVLQSHPPRSEPLRVSPALTVGACVPWSDPQDMTTQAATEQSADDALATVFETEPLPADIEIVGTPVLRVTFKANRPVAKLAARLNEITADGRSWMVTYGAVNLAHNADHSKYEPIEPGVATERELLLYFVSRRFHKGSRIRLSVSQSQWPIVWPVPEALDLSLLVGATVLELPVRRPPPREVPMSMALRRDTNLKSRAGAYSGHDWSGGFTAEGSPASRRVHIRAFELGVPSLLEPIAMKLGGSTLNEGQMIEGDCNSYRMYSKSTETFERPGWSIAVTGDATMTSTATDFIVDEGIEAWYNGAKIFERRWTNHIKRNGN